MRVDLTVCGADGIDCDVAVLADAAVPFREVSAALVDALGAPADVPRWWSGDRLLRHTDRLGDAGLRTGARITATPPAPGRGVPRVHVVGGIDAGTSWTGTRRTVVVGRGADCDLPLHDPDVSRRHAQVSFTASRVLVRDLGSTNGTVLGAVRVSDDTEWHPGQLLRVGDTHLAVTVPALSRAAVRPGPDGALAVSPRRRVPASPPPVIDRSPPDPPPPRPSLGWPAVALPALSGAGLALWTGSLIFVLIAVATPLVVVAGTLAQRLRHRRRDRHRRADAASAAARTEATVAAALQDEAAALRRAFPDAATVEAIACGPSDRLWERSGDDPELLCVRLGLADLPSRAQVLCGSDSGPAGILHAVPAVVDLAAGPIGLVGPRPAVRAIARWLVVQLATLAAPGDLAIEVRTTADAAWRWARWLPHSRSSGSGPAARVTVLDGTGDSVDAAGVIYLADSRAELPAACTRVVAAANECGTRLDLGARIVLTDALALATAERMARALAPLVPASSDAPTAVPAGCRLSNVLGPADADALRREWATSDGSASAVLGVGSDGPLRVDLDRDGPHVLVAGTTGAGKSELLRTMVVTLACAHPPDEINFVLVDYKGGAAFAECAGLPHVAGLVTDLDEHLTARALASLDAELRKRERLLAGAGVADLGAYHRASAEPPLPRLVVVVDEYATLATELPDFVSGLTGVAQRGRSLGLHLVLATQRPAGVVTAQVRANCALRIALRVTDAADSQDVIEGPEAAAIPHDLPGRAYVWTDGRRRAVQIARTDLPAGSSGAVTVALLGPGRTLNSRPASSGETELAAYAAAVAVAAGCQERAAPPWTPPLPERIPLDAVSLPGPATTVAIGQVDVPRRQRQQPLAVDLAAGGAVVVAGAPRSGRTSVLTTMAFAAARRLPPDGLHVHAIALSGTLAAVLGELPHTGTLVHSAEQWELVAPLLDEWHRAAERTPSLLLVDGWEGFVRASEDEDGGRAVDRVLATVRAGHRGRTVVIAGDRSVLAPHLAALATARLLLRLPDRTDYALAGIPRSAVPAAMPPGRALLAPDGTEVQLASTCPPDELVTARARWPQPSTAARLHPLPAAVPLSTMPSPGALAAFALAAPRCAPVGIPLANGARLLVAGPPRSGRSTALATLAHQAARSGAAVTAVAPRRSAVHAAAIRLGLRLLHDDGAPLPDGRNSVLLVDDGDDLADTPLDDALVRWMRDRGPGAVVVACRTESAARAYRGLVAEVRRDRCTLVLQPGPTDGELIGQRLLPWQTGGPAGRGVLAGDPHWGPEFAAGPLRVQVAMPEAA